MTRDDSAPTKAHRRIWSASLWRGCEGSFSSAWAPLNLGRANKSSACPFPPARPGAPFALRQPLRQALPISRQ